MKIHKGIVMRMIDAAWSKLRPEDLTSEEEKRRIAARNADVRARVRMLRIETDVLTRRKLAELDGSLDEIRRIPPEGA